jgi:hypothetical protein
LKIPIDYELLKIYQAKCWTIFQQRTVIGHCGKLAANEWAIAWGLAEEDLYSQNSGPQYSTCLAAIINLLGTCWRPAKEKLVTKWPTQAKHI